MQRKVVTNQLSFIAADRQSSQRFSRLHATEIYGPSLPMCSIGRKSNLVEDMTFQEQLVEIQDHGEKLPEDEQSNWSKSYEDTED